MSEYIFFNGSRIKNLRGKKFGHLMPQKVIGIKNRYAVWECTCDLCGGVRNVSAKNLQTGAVTRCEECAKKKKIDVGRKNTQKKIQKKHTKKGALSSMDLTGKTFGFWTVLKKGEKKKCAQMWLCRCKCGTLKEVSVYNLLSGRSSSCGCRTCYSLLGKKIGSLKVSEIVKGENGIGCKCVCDCGNVIVCSASDLEWKRSCGCMGEIEKSEHTKLIWAKNGGQKLRTDNTSGVRGVKRANNKWGAYITFKREVYWLGTFENFNDAVEARKEAEKHLYGDFLKWYYEKFPEREKSD